MLDKGLCQHLLIRSIVEKRKYQIFARLQTHVADGF